MGGFLTLVSVENKKLRSRVSTWVMMIILVFIILGLSALLKSIYSNPQLLAMYTGTQQTSDWQTTLKNEIAADQAQLAQAEASNEPLLKNRIESLKMYIAKDQYALDHNISQDETNSIWNKVIQLDISVNPSLGASIALFVIIALSALVAGEFSDGTMRMMIPRPYSRNEILSAKLVSTLLYTLILFVEGLIFGFIFMGAFFGFQGLGAVSLLWTGSKIVEIPAFLNTLLILGLDFLQVFVYICFALLISVLTRSRAFSTGISIFLLLIGASLFQLLASYFTWGRYIVFAVSKFSMFITTGSPFAGVNLGFAMIVSAVYVVLFLFFSYFTFNKRDI